MRRNDETDYLIRYTTTTFSSASSHYQVSTIVGIELGSEDGKGQGGLCERDTGRHGRRDVIRCESQERLRNCIYKS